MKINCKCLLISLFVLFTHCLFAQQIDACYECKLKESCKESSVVQIQNQLVQYQIEDKDSIKMLLKEWEDITGKNEAIERLEILISIDEGDLINRANTQYYKFGINEFIRRLYAIRHDINYSNYTDWLKCYDYVEPNGIYDQWTKSIATKLLRYQSLGTDEYLMCLLFAHELDDFDTSLRKLKKQNSNLYSDYVHNNPNLFRVSEGFYKVYTGLWMPIGKLRNDFNSGVNVGVSFGAPIRLDFRAEVKIQFTFLSDKSELDFLFDEEAYQLTDYSAITFGFRIMKENKLTNRMFLDLIAEANLGVLATNIKNDDDESYGSYTPDLGLGFGLKKLNTSGRSIGIDCLLHFSPYNIDPSLRSQVGNLYLSTNVYYGF